MNQAQVDYAALRFKTAKDLGSVANSVKTGNVAVETVYVENLGKRIMKFRCPPGTRRGGQWTDRLGTDCNLGPARAGLAKITRTVSRIDNALQESEQRVANGGPGLVRYQTGRAVERAGEIVDYAADEVRKRGKATRVRLGQSLERAGEKVDEVSAQLRDAYEKTKVRVGEALERAGEAFDAYVEARRLKKLVGKPSKADLEDDLRHQAALALIDQITSANLAKWLETNKIPAPYKPETGLLLTDNQKRDAALDLASRLHEAWRSTRLKPDGTYEPRMKDDGNGGEIDIANTPFADLPEKWQAENLAAASHAVNQIDKNPKATDDQIAAEVHNAWLKRNEAWAPDELKVPYADLPQDEKNKDLAIVTEARDAIDKRLNPPDPEIPEPQPEEPFVPYQSDGFKPGPKYNPPSEDGQNVPDTGADLTPAGNPAKKKPTKKPKKQNVDTTPNDVTPEPAVTDTPAEAVTPNTPKYPPYTPEMGMSQSEWDNLTPEEQSAIKSAVNKDMKSWWTDMYDGSPFINSWYTSPLLRSRQARAEFEAATTPFEREMARHRIEANRRAAEWTLRRSTNSSLGNGDGKFNPFSLGNDTSGDLTKPMDYTDSPHLGIDPKLLEALNDNGMVDPAGDNLPEELFQPFDGEIPQENKFPVAPSPQMVKKMQAEKAKQEVEAAGNVDVPEGDGFDANLPEVDKQPIPQMDEGKVPKPERTVLDKPEDGKKPSGPAKAAGATLDDATAKNAKKTKQKLPGEQFGGVFKKEDSAKKWAAETALNYNTAVYVAKGPDGKFRLYDEQMFTASGHELVTAYNSMGGVIDLPSVEAQLDVTPDEIVDQVKEADLIEKADLIDDLNMPTAPAGQLELKKSKTGQFLPDDFSSAHLDAEQHGAFTKAWNAEVGKVYTFWEDRVGKIDDPKAGLKAIDDYIAQKAIDDPNPGKLGVLNAERNNFLAMVVPHPDDKSDLPDLYERINFVGPSRRSSIIKAAGLEDFLVSKKKAKAGETKKIEKGAPKPSDSVLKVYSQSEFSSEDILAEAAKLAKETNAKTFVREDGAGWKIVTEQHLKDVAWTDAERKNGIINFDPETGTLQQPKATFGQYHDDAALKVQPGSNGMGTLMAHMDSKKASIDEAAAKNAAKSLDKKFAEWRNDDGKLDAELFEQNLTDLKGQYSTAFLDVAQKTEMGTVTETDLNNLVFLGENLREFEISKPKFYDMLHDENSVKAVESIPLDVLDVTPEHVAEEAAKAARKEAAEKAKNVEDGIQMAMSDNIWVSNAKGDLTSKWDAEIPNFNDEASLNAWFDAQEVAAAKQAEDSAAAIEEAKQKGVISFNDVKDHVVTPEHRKEWLATAREEAKAKLASNVLDETTNNLKDLSTGDKNLFYMLDAEGDVTFVPTGPDGIASANEIIDAINASTGDKIMLDGAAFTKEEAIAIVKMKESGDTTIPTPASESVTPDLTQAGMEAAFSALFEADLEDFDYSTLLGYESAKMTDIPSIKARYDKYGKRLDDYLSKLPENFETLSTDEKLAALRTATGTTTNKRAAIEFSRAAFAAQYGKSDALSKLHELSTAESSPLLPEVVASKVNTLYGSAAEVDKAIESAKNDLVAAQEQLNNLGYAPEAVLNAYKAKINDAKARLAAASIGKYQLVKGADQAKIEDIAKAGQEMAKAVDMLDPKIRESVEKSIYNGVSVQKADIGSLSAKGMMKPASSYDSSLLGVAQTDGKAIAHSIPVGHKGLWTADDAATHISTGGKLSDVPDAFLVKAIENNLGKGKRFTQDPNHKKGFNESYTAIDTLTGQRYVIKESERNHMEHIQEAAGAVVMQKLGYSTQGIRFGSELHEGPLPAEQKKIEGVAKGLQRTMVIDTAHNFFGGQVFDENGKPTANADGYTVFGSIANVPKDAEWDGQSLASMMVLDRSMMYIDRTSANMIAIKGPDGKVRLHPFDHGNAFRAFDGSKIYGNPTENAIGFVTPTKGDNVDLMALVSKLSPEEREAWAVSLADGVERFKKTNWGVEFKSVADSMKLTPEERMRLEAHANFLEKRKGSLDWDSMMKSAMGKGGFDSDQAADFIAGGHKVKAFKLPQDTKTISNSADKVAAMPSRNAGFSLMYDGDDILDFHVMAREVDVKDMPGADGNPTSATKATQLVFKLSPETYAATDFKDFKTFPGGHVVPSGDIDTGAMWNFSPPNKLDSAPGSYNVDTMYRVLPDGSLVMITKGNNKHGMTGTVRILIPGDAKEVMNDETRVAAAMQAVGVKEHGLPTAKQVQKMGLRQLAGTILGKGTSSMSDDDIEKQLAQKGFAPDDIELGVDIGGSPVVRLTREATDRLMKDNKLSGVKHKLDHGTNVNDTERKQRVISIFTSGTLASTNRRFEHGIHIEGWSSSTDAGYGSSDHLFFRPGYDNASFKPLGSDSLSVSNWHWVGAGQAFWSNINIYTTATDDCGNTDAHVPWSQSIGAGRPDAEIMVRSAWRPSTGITVVPDQYYNTIIKGIKDRGVTQVDGIPIEDLIAKPSEAAEKGKKLLTTLKAKGVVW